MTPDVHPEDKTWLARVERVTEHTGFLSAVLAPLAWQDGESWRSLSGEDAAELFPERGRAFWYGRPPNVERDALVVVRLEHRHKFRQTGENEAFQVEGNRWAHAQEILDLRALGDRAVRLALTGDGLAVALSTPHVYILVEDGAVAGPLMLTRAPGGKWRLPPGDYTQVEVRPIVDGGASRVRLGDRDALIVHDVGSVGRPVRMLNWAPDDKLAAGILKALRNLDRDAAKALGVADAVFRKYVEVFENYVPTTDLVRLQGTARVERVVELVQVVADDQALLSEAAEALLAHPSVQDALVEPKRLAVEAALLDARASVEEELAEARTTLDADLVKDRATLSALREHRAELARENDALGAQTAALQQDHAAATRALVDAQASLDDQVAAVAAALDDRLAALAARPAELFAEASILRALTGSQASKPGSLVTPAPAILSATEPPANVPRLDADTGRQALTSRLMDLGLDPSLAPALIATLSSGRAIVAAGDGGHDVLGAFADVFAGGRLVWIPVSPTLFDPAALLTQPTTAGGATPHPGGLLATLEAARTHDGLVLVVIDGYDRAATDHYLDPLLQCYRDADRGRGARTLPYVGLDGAPMRLAWPANVLIACVPSAAESAIAPSRSFWADAVLLDAGDAVAEAEAKAELSDVSLTDWAADSEPVVETASLSGAAPTIRRAAEELYQRARAAALSHDRARRLAFTGSVVPALSDADAVTLAAEANFPGAADLAKRSHALVSALRPS